MVTGASRRQPAPQYVWTRRKNYRKEEGEHVVFSFFRGKFWRCGRRDNLSQLSGRKTASYFQSLCAVGKRLIVCFAAISCSPIRPYLPRQSLPSPLEERSRQVSHQPRHLNICCKVRAVESSQVFVHLVSCGFFILRNLQAAVIEYMVAEVLELAGKAW